MWDTLGGFNPTKLKSQLKMAVSRFQIASNKKAALLKQNMRDVAVLLSEDPPKEEKARIKAEALIRDDDMIEAYDILSLNCDLLSERIKLIQYSKECPNDLISCVSTLIYASPRVDIPELVEIRKQFRAKYGKKFEEAALQNFGGVLNERVLTKLSVQPPAAYLVQTYLEKICEKYEVDWKSPSAYSNIPLGEPMPAPMGRSVGIAQGTGLGSVLGTTSQPPFAEVVREIQKEDLPRVPSAIAYPSNSNSTFATQQDFFEEPDIFIPPAPGHSKTSAPLAPPATPTAPPADERNDDDDDNSGAKASGSQTPSNQMASYQDLAARFENLKNL